MTEPSPPPTPTDNLMGRVIYVVGAVLMLSVVGIIVLAFKGNPIPDVLQNIAVGALGVLGALLAGKRSG